MTLSCPPLCLKFFLKSAFTQSIRPHVLFPIWPAPQVNRCITKIKPHWYSCWPKPSEVIFSPYFTVERVEDSRCAMLFLTNPLSWGKCSNEQHMQTPRTQVPANLACHLEMCEQWAFGARPDTPWECSYFGNLNPVVGRGQNKLKLTLVTSLGSALWEGVRQADSCHLKCHSPGTMHFIFGKRITQRRGEQCRQIYICSSI